MKGRRGRGKQELVMHGDFILRGVVSQGRLPVRERQQQAATMLMFAMMVVSFVCCLVVVVAVVYFMMSNKKEGQEPAPKSYV